MLGRLLDSRFAFLVAAPVMVPLAILAALRPEYALGAIGVALLLLFAVARVELLLLVLAAALPWEGVLDYPTEAVSVVKLLGVLLFGAWLMRSLLRGEPLRVSPALGWVGAFALAVCLSLLFTSDPAASMVDTLRYALFAVFFFLVLQLVQTFDDVRRLVRVVVLSSSVAAAWGLYGFIALGRARAAGPISDPNDFAYLLACTLPLACYLAAEDKRRRTLWLACCIVMAAATLATLSRGALIGLAALAPWAIFTRRVPLSGVLLSFVALLSVAAVGFALWAPVLQDRLAQKNAVADQNVAAREALWSGAIRIAAAHPITGIGPGRFRLDASNWVRNNPVPLDKPVVHNSYLHVLAELGLLGLVAFVGFLASSWRLLSRGHRRADLIGDRDGRRLATAMQASLIVAIVAGVFLSEQFTTPFWMIGALATVVAGVPQAVRVTGTSRAVLGSPAAASG